MLKDGLQMAVGNFADGQGVPLTSVTYAEASDGWRYAIFPAWGDGPWCWVFGYSPDSRPDPGGNVDLATYTMRVRLVVNVEAARELLHRWGGEMVPEP